MAKVKDYFSHDYYARSSLRDVRKDFGLEGVGFYWCFVEMLHENGGTLKVAELDGIAFDLRTSPELVTKVVQEYGLFVVKNGKITNARVTRNLAKREEVSEARRNAANSRWNGGTEGETPSTSEDGNDGEGEKPIPYVPEEEVRPLGSAFVSSDAKADFKKSAQWYIDWFEERIADLEEQEDYDIYSPIAHTGSVLNNLIKAICEYPKVMVARRKVDSIEVVQTLQYFVRSKHRVEELESIICEVNEKHEGGRIKNKQSYLISALYQAAKVNGG